MKQSIEKSFLIDPQTTNNAIYYDSLILKSYYSEVKLKSNLRLHWRSNSAISLSGTFGIFTSTDCKSPKRVERMLVK